MHRAHAIQFACRLQKPAKLFQFRRRLRLMDQIMQSRRCFVRLAEPQARTL